MTDWFDSGSSSSPADVGALLDSDKIVAHLVGIIERGALLSLGKTSDGGAMSVTVTLDGRWRREYFRDQGDLEVWVEQAYDAVSSAPPPASRGRGSGQRSRKTG